MKNLTKLFVAVAVLFACSCANDLTQDLGVNVGGQTVLTLSLEDTRTQLGEKADGVYPLYWSEGDQISINGVASKPLSAQQAGSDSATFEVDGVHTTLNVAYPAADANQVLFAEQQAHKSNTTFGNNATTLYGVGSIDKGVALKHLTGVLKIGVKGSATLTHAQISTIDRAPIAGAFDIDFTNGEVAATKDAVPTINYSFGDGVALSSTPTYMHIAVPAGEYDEMYVTLYDNNDGAMYAIVKAGEAKPLTAGDVREFTSAIEYAPNAQVAIIKDVASLKAWASSALTADAVMVADVDMSNEAWTPVDGFSGYFLGNGYAIKGLKAPLLGTTTTRGIKGLHLVDIDMEITNLPNAGALACDIQNEDAEISHCSASGKMVINLANDLKTPYDEYFWFGGLVGYSISKKDVTDLYSNVAIETKGAITNPNKEHTRIAGVISYAGGSALKNITNVGTITHNATANGTLILAGIVTDGAIGMSNCVNGIPNSDGTAGSITVYNQHKKNANLAGVTTYINGLVENCHNYGNLYTEHFANAGRVCGFAFQSQGGEVRNCSNHGKVTTGANYGTDSSTHYISGFLGIEAKNTTTTLYNCCNHGDVELAEGFQNRYFSLGGILARKDATGSTIILEKCCNYGKLSINGTILRSCYMGGIVGLNASNATGGGLTLIDCVNYGQLTANATMKQGEAFRIGGVIATSGLPLLDATQPTSNWNKGDIVLNLTDGGKAAEATGQLSVGGAIGSLSAGVSVVLENTSFYNEGDITVNLESGKYPQVGGVGGVIGYISDGQIANANSFCNISAIGHEGRVGAIAGFGYTDTEKATNCNVGGTIKVAEGEAVTLTKNNYLTYAYPSYPATANPSEDVAQNDKCGYISSIDATPVYAEVVRDVYTISTADELLAFAADVANVNKNVELTADIDMTGKEWTTINGFSKTFDGQNFKIKGLNAPFFGETQASFKNLHLEDVDITVTASGTADVNVGVLAGNLLNADAVLENCSASGEFKVIGDSPSKTVRPCGLVSWAATAKDIKNLVNKVNITMTGTYAGTIVAAGCICATDGNNPKMIDCQNLGNMAGNATFNGNVYILGVAGLTGDMINCVNGSADGKGKYGNIKVEGSTIGYLYLAGVCGSKSKTRDNITGCVNYGNIEIGGTRAHKKSQYMYISGISPTSTTDAISNCTNYGDITCSIVSGSGETHQFAGIGCTNNESKLTTVKNCANYGDINITKDASFTNTAATIQVHGVCRVSHTVNTLENLCNNGNLSVYGSVASTLYISGVASTVSANATVTGTLANTGDITVGVAATGKTYVGGIFAIHDTNTLTLAEGAKLEQSGAIECNGQFAEISEGGIFGSATAIAFGNGSSILNSGSVSYSGTATKGVRVGGIIGNSVATTAYTIPMVNTGDVSYNGTYGSDFDAYVGGCVGYTAVGISNATALCSVTAVSLNNAGMIMGVPYAETNKASNCKVGGAMCFAIGEYGPEDDPQWGPIPTAINAGNFYKYIYSNRSLDSSIAEADGCSYISKIE